MAGHRGWHTANHLLDGTAEEVDVSGDTFTVGYYGAVFKDDSVF